LSYGRAGIVWEDEPGRRIRESVGGLDVARVLRMPEVDDDPSDAVLAEWLVVESGAFAGSQSIATVETEKLLVSVEVAEPGILLKALVPEGALVGTGTPLAVLADLDEHVADLDALLVELGLADPGPVEATPVAAPADEHAESYDLFAAWSPRLTPGDEDDADVTAALLPGSPWAEPEPSRLAALATLALPPGPGPEPSAPPDPVFGSRPLPRTTVASASAEVIASPARLRTTVRAEPLLAVLSHVGDVRISDLVVKAVGGASRAEPRLNAERLAVDVAVAVSTPAGLQSCVVRDVNALTATGVAEATRRRQEAVRAGGGPEEGRDDVVVTVVVVDTPGVEEMVLDPEPGRPAVLAVGAVTTEPVVEDGDVVVGQVVRLTLSVDQSLADAAVAARWLRALTDLLANPVRFLA
jgi:pyruvate dehydrogenase E2 component (dihydrolipoamide acetyltransferase)